MTQKQKLPIANGLYYMAWGLIFLILSPLFLPAAIIAGIMRLDKWVDDTRKQGQRDKRHGAPPRPSDVPRPPPPPRAPRQDDVGKEYPC